MPKESRVYLEDMLAAAQRILAAANTSREQFEAEWMRYDAVRYNLIILGEIVKRLPDSFQTQYPQIPWRRIAGLRNRIVHDYDELYIDTLLDIIHHDVRQLAADL